MIEDDAKVTDTYHLQRFLEAQASTFAQARAELRGGKKRSHWMWYIFPQIAGLGSSPMSQKYAISSIAEGKAYLAHPVLGDRLRECTSLVNDADTRSIEQIFGYPDDLKFHSSVTLFALIVERDGAPGGDGGVFSKSLTKYFNGLRDQATLDRVKL